MGNYVKAAKADELAEGGGKLVEVNGKRIALFKSAGKYCAIDDVCTHRGGPLSEGLLEGDVVTCPWHGAQFSIASGEVMCPPAPTPVNSYKVKVEGSDIEIEI